MVISKCVPMQISRKRFSDFVKNHTPQDMVFVGWKYDQEDPQIDLSKKKRKNVQLNYKHIKQDFQLSIEQCKQELKQWVIQNGGGSGGGSDTPTQPVYQGIPSQAKFYPVSMIDQDGFYVQAVDQDGNGLGIPAKNVETWDENAGTNVINLQEKHKGFVEINGGGQYKQDILFVINPYHGSITTIVIDNTGRDRFNAEQDQSELLPKYPFVLKYGIADSYQQVLTVPVNCRGVVQILHSKDSDIIINSSYTSSDVIGISDVKIQQNKDDLSDVPYQGRIVGVDASGDQWKLYIDMNNQSGFVQISTNDYIGKSQFTFMFDKTEIGSMTYLVLDNSNGETDVVLNYGKIFKQTQDSSDIHVSQQTVDVVSVGQKSVVQIFHSRSVDIIVKVTKV